MPKLVKMSMMKLVLKVLDEEYFMAILKSINQLLINTPGHNKAKFLIYYTRMYVCYNVIYDSSLYFASLDFKFLFTDIPLYETINNCVSDLQNQNLYNGKRSKRDLFKLLETATSESSFIFDYLLYKQVDRVGMGSPLGLTLANTIMKKMVG